MAQTRRRNLGSGMSKHTTGLTIGDSTNLCPNIEAASQRLSKRQLGRIGLCIYLCLRLKSLIVTSGLMGFTIKQRILKARWRMIQWPLAIGSIPSNANYVSERLSVGYSVSQIT